MNTYEAFTLYYSYSGPGSGMGSMQPVFRVTGTRYVYTLEQNSFYGSPDKKPEAVCEGTVRNSSIDSILSILSNINDSIVYKTNTAVMSGGVHTISVRYNKIHLTFRLHNHSDPDAEKIVDILNSNIPEDKQKLRLFVCPGENK